MAQVVDPGMGTPTTTTTSSSAATVYGGDTITLTVDVTSGGAPTGNVTIFHKCSQTCGTEFQPVATVAAGDGLRGRLEAGARLSTPSGIMLDFAASYDGIGASGYHATTGRAVLRMPLN